jgi:hypothetical protein
MKQLEVHPAAANLPMMPDDELADLAADIRRPARRHLACYLARRRRGLRARAGREIDAVAIEGYRHEAARQTDQTSLRL